jgi:hypothetical protein
MNSLCQPEEASSAHTREWDAVDRWSWIAVGVLCALIIWIVDDSPISALAWLAMSLLRTYHQMPAIFMTVGRLSGRRQSFLLDVALGWALIPGPLVGSLFGTLSPIIFGLPVSSFAGGLLGLLIGPVVAAVEGILLVVAFNLVLRIVTGKSLFDESL